MWPLCKYAFHNSCIKLFYVVKDHNFNIPSSFPTENPKSPFARMNNAAVVSWSAVAPFPLLLPASERKVINFDSLLTQILTDLSCHTILAFQFDLWVLWIGVPATTGKVCFQLYSIYPHTFLGLGCLPGIKPLCPLTFTTVLATSVLAIWRVRASSSEPEDQSASNVLLTSGWSILCRSSCATYYARPLDQPSVHQTKSCRSIQFFSANAQPNT